VTPPGFSAGTTPCAKTLKRNTSCRSHWSLCAYYCVH
jgi:hypothetical protein